MSIIRQGSKLGTAIHGHWGRYIGYFRLGSLDFTFHTNKFDAYDPAVTEAMKSTSVVLTKETTVWRAWVGFNASHSLGAMLVAGVYIPLTISYFEVIQSSVWFSVLPVNTGLRYHSSAYY
ncbi:MAG: LIC_13387 family protein [Arenicella sp.]